ncbi:MAG: response regulator transcription factor [Bacteroidetes bacterium]|nr:response regulator transcription factor [Bacteroidota bacterium]
MGRKFKFLLVDDNKSIRESLEEILKLFYEEAEIAGVASGPECITELDRFIPDIIFMDISMPGMSGVETTRLVMAKYPAYKIIAYSMNDNDEMLSKMFKAGAQGYVLKSDDIETLQQAINKIVNGQA